MLPHFYKETIGVFLDRVKFSGKYRQYQANRLHKEGNKQTDLYLDTYPDK